MPSTNSNKMWHDSNHSTCLADYICTWKKKYTECGCRSAKLEEPKLGVKDPGMIWSITKKCGPKGK